MILLLISSGHFTQGRFRDAFLEIVTLLRSEDLLPPKRLGAVVCAAIIDRSSHAKARLLACQLCLSCVDKSGLQGIGKRGVVATAKLLSEETIPENRSAALDLAEMILLKMGGDIQLLVRICGTNLNDKARQMLEERWQKREVTHIPSVSSNGLQSRSSDLTSTHEKKSPRHELPALTLRTNLQSSRVASQNVPENTDSVFGIHAFSSTTSNEPPNANCADQQSFGDAASLRARLLEIRQNSKPVAEMEVMQKEAFYEFGISSLQKLMERGYPVAENDAELVNCTEMVRKFHAALSKQQKAPVGLSTEELSELRIAIVANVNGTVGKLTR